MSKPRLRLVHSANGTRLGVVHRQRDRSVRLLVLQGGRAKSALAETPWEAGLRLINLGLLASGHNYLAFLQASMALLEACNRADPEKTVW